MLGHLSNHIPIRTGLPQQRGSIGTTSQWINNGWRELVKKGIRMEGVTSERALRWTGTD